MACTVLWWTRRHLRVRWTHTFMYVSSRRQSVCSAAAEEHSATAEPTASHAHQRVWRQIGMGGAKRSGWGPTGRRNVPGRTLL